MQRRPVRILRVFMPTTECVDVRVRLEQQPRRRQITRMLDAPVERRVLKMVLRVHVRPRSEQQAKELGAGCVEERRLSPVVTRLHIRTTADE